MSEVVSIVYSPGRGSYNRQPLAEARLLAGYGIQHDRKGGHPKRQLNIMDDEVQQDLAAGGFPTGPGVLGEQLILRGVRISDQVPGTRLRIGSEAVVEVIELREGCYKLTALDARMPAETAGGLGVMASVVRGGTICVGDPVMLLSDES